MKKEEDAQNGSWCAACLSIINRALGSCTFNISTRKQQSLTFRNILDVNMPTKLCNMKELVHGLEQKKKTLPFCTVVLAHTYPSDWITGLRVQTRQNVPGYSELHLQGADWKDGKKA